MGRGADPIRGGTRRRLPEAKFPNARKQYIDGHCDWEKGTATLENVNLELIFFTSSLIAFKKLFSISWHVRCIRHGHKFIIISIKYIIIPLLIL